MLSNLFELLPVFLALVSAVMCARRYGEVRRRRDRVVMALGVVCSLILVVAQTSWWTSYIVQGSLLGTVFANALWTVFNTLVMLAFILASLPRRKWQ